jgi:hypothetical protein
VSDEQRQELYMSRFLLAMFGLCAVCLLLF